MEFDYQTLKDAEGRQREERISTLPITVTQAFAEKQPSAAGRKPPVKPRRSIKIRPVTQESRLPIPPATHAAQEGGIIQTEVTVAVKRVSPAMFGPVGPLEALSPSLRAHTLLWFHRSQLPRLQKQGQPLPRWLHGFATRREAEHLLQDQPLGCFLLRLSESKIGFVLSYRGKDRCRHFIIEEEDESPSSKGGKYLIAGESSSHSGLEKLISYYTEHPVGPYDEMLTVPCTKTNRLNEDIMTKNAGEMEQKTQPCSQASPSPAPDLKPLPEACEAASNPTPEYAVVRKVLRKSLSLPESPCVQDTAEVFNPASSPKESTVFHYGPSDFPYARVNKPLRAATQMPQAPACSSASSPQGATALFAPIMPQAASEQKYWHLEPEHTYEETPGTARNEQIDFYAVGQWRDVQHTEGNSRNHVYSEVNLRGTPENPALPSEHAPIRAGNGAATATSLRTTPNLPWRPPPKHPNAFARKESSMQNTGGPNVSTSPSRSSLFPSQPTGRPPSTGPSAIYEQIPERSSGPRPPLPPANPKR